MKITVQKSKMKISRKAYSRAVSVRPAFLRIYSNTDMGLFPKPVSKYRRLLRQYKNWRPKLVWPNMERLNFAFARQAITVLSLFALLGYAGMFQVAQAYFNAVLVSHNNTVMAGNLNFTVAVNGSPSSAGLLPGQSASKTVSVTNNGSVKFQYNVTSQQVSGNTDLCQALNLKAVLHGTEYYNGTLFGLNTGNILYNADAGDWTFTITLPADAPVSLSQQVCSYKLIFSGWQWNLQNSSTGFVSVGEIEFSLGSGQWSVEPPPSPASGVVLNEFLPRPKNNGHKPDGEWVELYNLSASDTVDLAGYYLKDDYTGNGPATHIITIEPCRTDSGKTTILPHGFLVVYANAGEHCNSHGFELNNTGDTVNLYNPDGQLVDSHTYDGNNFCELTPTPGSGNNDSAGSETCDHQVPQNKSIARIPDGIGEWVDPIPTPGQPNKLNTEDQNAASNQGSNTVLTETAAQVVVPEKIEPTPVEPAVVSGGDNPSNGGTNNSSAGAETTGGTSNE